MSRNYLDAAKMLNEIIVKKRGLKTSVYNGENKNKSMIFALVCQTIKYKAILEDIISNTGLKDLDVKREILLILMYEHIFGQKIRGGGKVKRMIIEKDGEIQVHLEKIKDKLNVKNNEDILPKEKMFPRFEKRVMFIFLS